MTLCGIVWYCVVVCGRVWYCVVLCGIVWYCVVLCGILWYVMVLNGVAWRCVVLCGIGSNCFDKPTWLHNHISIVYGAISVGSIKTQTMVFIVEMCIYLLHLCIVYVCAFLFQSVNV